MTLNQKLKGNFFENRVQVNIIKDGTDTYICEAEIGTPISVSKWAITKIDSYGNIMYPLNIENKPVYSMEFLPSQATSLTYSY